MSLPKTIYLGAFVHSVSLQKLEICTTGAIGVDETGKIAFIERSAQLADYTSKTSGWESAQVVPIRDNGFFFPGFIGM